MQQDLFQFARDGSEEGYNSWAAQRQEKLDALAREMGLPLGHQVEVWIRGGIRLRGLMTLREQGLWIDAQRDFSLELVVDRVVFTAAEIESCVRLD